MSGKPPPRPAYTCPCGKSMYQRWQWDGHKIECPIYNAHPKGTTNDGPPSEPDPAND